MAPGATGAAPEVLVIGAGAVGQVFAYCYQRGGANVTFLVRDRYRDEAAKGFTLYPLNKRRHPPVTFAGFGLVTSARDVAARRFDQVVLTVSSPALRGPWLAELLAAAGDATIVALQPGLDDRGVLLAAGADPERLVQGIISLISYHAPLPGEARFPRPGMAFWFPPLAPSPFSGPVARVDAVVKALTAGGLPAKRHKDVGKSAGFPTAVMMPYLAALELGGWTVRGAVNSGTLALGARGAREAIAVVGHALGKPPLRVRLLARPRILRLGVWAARPIIPLPLETYLREHFTKVGDQTTDFLDLYIAKGRAANLAVEALSELASRRGRGSDREPAQSA